MPTSVRHLKQAFKGSMPIVLFAQWPDDKLYYAVTIVKLDEKKGKCLVKFEDGLESWYTKAELHLQYHTSCYPYDESDDIFCCLCDSYESDRNNEIILCDVCQQGFHQKCHQPKVSQLEVENFDKEWQCNTCTYILAQLDPLALSSTPKANLKSKSKTKKDSPRSLAMKASLAKRQAAIKLTRDKKTTKKSSQEAPKNKTAAPEPMIQEDQHEQSSTTDTPEESPEKSPVRKDPEPQPDPAQMDDNKEDEEAGHPDDVDTEKFIDAVVKKTAPAKAKTAASKVPKKAATKKSSKIPAPA